MKIHVFAFLIAGAFAAAVSAQPIDLIQDGASRYVIYHEVTAPRSVAQAAAELQDYLQRVSGAKLPIVNRPRP
ncbi:MAG TPA: hypothetical protein PLY87_17870 [Planctomycetaceae bacterium]|nr:hypothetical protein [Planctomycetaceae bacterium]HQZ66966.1 hypothetical protein [Planctomycetaceae bacterium]